MISNDMWRRIETREFDSPRAHHGGRHWANLTKTQIAKIRELHREGVSLTAIAGRFGVSIHPIADACGLGSWRKRRNINSRVDSVVKPGRE